MSSAGRQVSASEAPRAREEQEQEQEQEAPALLAAISNAEAGLAQAPLAVTALLQASSGISVTARPLASSAEGFRVRRVCLDHLGARRVLEARRVLHLACTGLAQEAQLLRKRRARPRRARLLRRLQGGTSPTAAWCRMLSREKRAPRLRRGVCRGWMVATRVIYGVTCRGWASAEEDIKRKGVAPMAREDQPPTPTTIK